MHRYIVCSFLLLLIASSVIARPPGNSIERRQWWNWRTRTSTTTRAPVTTTTKAATTSTAATTTITTTSTAYAVTTTTTPPSTSTDLSFPNVPTSSGATSPPPTDSDRTDCLAAHNAVRQSVPVADKPADLAYSQDLEQAACAWSRYLANTGKFEHSSGKVGKFGENLYKSWTSNTRSTSTPLGSCRAAVTSWAAESTNYSAGQTIGSGSFGSYGHYTQIVWPSTTSVGCCGWMSADGKTTVWTCEYNPPGNYLGQAAY